MRSGGTTSTRRHAQQPAEAIPDDLIFYDFILAFFRFQAILYTKISIDELDDIRSYMFKLMHEYFGLIDKEVNKKDEINRVVHISLCMIFAAHATIADVLSDSKRHSSKSEEEAEERKAGETDMLEHVMRSTLPSMALSQIAELLGLILDRILSVPSPWLEGLTSIVTWLALHQNDSLLPTLYVQAPNLRKDMARVHQLIANHLAQQTKTGKLPEEEQIKLLELMGSTLLPEEYFFIGFLPLQSFVDKAKSISNGQKCP